MVLHIADILLIARGSEKYHATRKISAHIICKTIEQDYVYRQSKSVTLFLTN